MGDIERLERRLQRERQARKQAELIAEQKTREIFQANQELHRLNDELEERVRERTAELHAVLDTITYGILILDPELRIITHNRAYREMWTIPEEFFAANPTLREDMEYTLGQGLYPIFEDEWNEYVTARLKEIREGNIPPSEFQLASGKVLQYRCIELPDGGRMLTYFDITELKRVEEALRASEERYALVTEASDEGIYDWRMPSDELYVSDRLSSFFGFGSGEIPASSINWIDYVHPEDRERYHRTMVSHLKGHTATWECEYRARDKDGRFYWLLDHGATVRNSSGTAIRLVGAVRNITKRKEAEKIVREKTESIRLLQVIASAANEAQSVEDAMQIALERICAYSGWPVGHVYTLADDLSGEVESTDLWHIEETSRFSALKSATQGTRWGAGRIGLIGPVLQNSRPAWIRDVTSDAGFQRGRAAGEIGVRGAFAFPVLVGREVVAVLEFFSEEAAEPNEALLDIMAQAGTQLGRVVERKRAEAQLRVAKEEAESATHAKTRFLANMSHELRTPLNAVIGLSEMLQEDAQDLGYEDFTEPLERIVGAGKHLLHLINEILDLAKIEAGKVELHLEYFDISSMVDGTVSTAMPMAEKNGNRIIVRCPDELGSMFADLTRVRQVILNLLSNAGKFTKNGEIVVEAARKHQEQGDYFELTVSDTGIGMTPEQLGKLFQEFSQADSSVTRKYGGAGLGLVISRRFCNLMGGDIEVASIAGEGSHFTVQLPTKVERRAAPRIEQGGNGASAAASTNTVLVVDDDATARGMMQRFLIKEGFEVVTASNGEEGLRLARRLTPSVITLDVIMPEVDGWDVLRQLKSEPALAGIPVVMLTILDEKNKGYTLGATDYVTKPINRDYLRTVLQKYASPDASQRVLLVEDDEATRRALRRALTDEGWQVTEAQNGRVALERLNRVQVRLILLDLMMPEMDGFEFLAELRKQPLLRHVPVVVVTGADLTEDDRRHLNGGVERILSKAAYTEPELLNEIRNLVARHVEPGAFGRSDP